MIFHNLSIYIILLSHSLIIYLIFTFVRSNSSNDLNTKQHIQEIDNVV